MQEIVGETLARRLVEWGVDTVFGLPGDGINGLMEGFRRQRDKLRFVLVHHEEAAAFMATGYAKATGRIGVCAATSGPGAIHLLNGLYDAKLDHVPVLALTGMQETSVLGSHYQQEVHTPLLYQDVAEAYNLMVTNPQQLPGVVDIAIRHALARRSVAHLSFPNDVQVAAAGADPYRHVSPGEPPTSSPVVSQPPVPAAQADLARAAEVLNAGKKVAMLVGIGARRARDEVLAVAEALASPIVKTLSGKMVVPDDHPLTTGGLGLLGTKPSEELMEECDTLLMVGTSFPYGKYLPSPGQARVVQIDIDSSLIGLRLPIDAAVTADAKVALQQLLPMLRSRSDRSFLEKYQRARDSWRADMEALEDSGRDPIAPQYLMSCIDEAATSDAILTCDSGTIATWAARHWTIRGNREFYLSGNLATMAPGLPYSVGMQQAFPGRQVIAFVGDGGFAMLMAEFLTAVRHELPIKVVINNNNAYGQILWEQIILGYPEYAVRHRQPEADFGAWARACGGFGVKVTDPKALPGAIREALAHPGPALVDCDVNPNEPPMPGKVRYEQAKHFTEAFLRGEPHKKATLASVARDKINELRS
ncbi:thiamine pyrophosphate-binding protein [Micromonospora sp. DR5-3]|uniref:thiamine pyrophosphate-dependent enzyme n=1 Tax=unclassified Micromonospora TaxID=2617518 RepID=UPI0011D32CC9|nr:MULTISPECIES: thiamine pyrophosphate-dependent enzyme [unclassified Micromonospora]MCW3819333.1 thiamine pyrophosphate-binding protein [Micromonospora sp. DR5-3]TYC21769.1 pyruvate oxidase [Micromonospora sp. MP36]